MFIYTELMALQYISGIETLMTASESGLFLVLDRYSRLMRFMTELLEKICAGGVAWEEQDWISLRDSSDLENENKYLKVTLGCAIIRSRIRYIKKVIYKEQ